MCFLSSQAAQHQDRRHHTNIKPKPTSKEMKLLPLLPNVALDLSRLDLRSKETEIWRLREKKWEKSLYSFSFFAAVQKWAHIFVAAGWTENKKIWVQKRRKQGNEWKAGRESDCTTESYKSPIKLSALIGLQLNVHFLCLHRQGWQLHFGSWFTVCVGGEGGKSQLFIVESKWCCYTTTLTCPRSRSMSNWFQKSVNWIKTQTVSASVIMVCLPWKFTRDGR